MVCLFVCLSAGHVREPAKTAEPIEMPFVGTGSCGPDEPCIRCEISPRVGQFLGLSGLLKSIGRVSDDSAAVYVAKGIVA